MLLIMSASDALKRTRRIEVSGRDYTLAEYVGTAPKRGIYVEGNERNDNGLPQGFLVMQPPGAVTPAHFHEPNQFQVFVEGDARIGHRSATPLTVQYANGHTPYGPIVALDAGVTYFTLRQHWDPGAKYLPASRDKLNKGKQRTRMQNGLNLAGCSELDGSSAPQVRVVFEEEPDGLAAWQYRLGPDQACLLPDPAAGGGQYLLVTSGAMVAHGTEIARHSIVFVSRDEPAYRVVTASSSLAFLVLQFPRAVHALGQECR
jgi:hypothetical protein